MKKTHRLGSQGSSLVGSPCWFVTGTPVVLNFTVLFLVLGVNKRFQTQIVASSFLSSLRLGKL